MSVEVPNHIKYKRRSRWILLTILVLLSGCAGLSGPDEIRQKNTENITTPTPEVTQTKTPVQTSSNISDFQNHTASERVRFESSKWFGEAVALNMEDHNQTSIHDSSGTVGNNVELAVTIDGNITLKRSIMDTAQTTAGMVRAFTTTNESLAAQNLSDSPVIQPDRIRVWHHDSSGEFLCSYSIYPKQAKLYQEGNVTGSEFSQAILNTFEPAQGVNLRRNNSLSHHLRQSELEVWVKHYREEITRSDRYFNKPLPVNDIQSSASRNEVLHEFKYSREEYDQSMVSAKRTAYGSYWRTIGSSYAKPPDRLNLFIHLAESEDFASQMEKRYAHNLIQRGPENPKFETYFDQAESWWVGEGETAFEDF